MLPHEPTRPGWRRSARWFAAEFAVVVAGILAALALQAWWQGRQDQNREQAYLHQLAADLRATERQVARADSIHQSVDRVGALLMRAYFAPVPLPRDSVLLWLGRTEWYEPVRPVTGTAEALALTGDIGLLRNPSLQAAVTAYLDESRALAEAHQIYIGMYNPAADRLLRRLGRGERLAQALHHGTIDSLSRADDLFWLPSGPRRPMPQIDTDAMLRERDVHLTLSEMNLAKRNLRSIRADMRSGARSLRAKVEVALVR